MALTLVLGPANSAKAGEVFGAYEAAAARGALLVVPTASDARHYSRELAQRGLVLGSVLTFGGLMAEVARRVGYEARLVSKLQRERILRAVVRDQRFEAIGRAAGAAGFVAAAGALIAELQRALVSPARFTQAMRTWAAADPRREHYARDVALLYSSYTRALERRGRVDGERHSWDALDALRAQPGRWGADAVFFYGFDDLSRVELDAIETLARVVGAAVTVSLTYEAGRPALEARADVVAELLPLAGQVLELPATDDYYEPSSSLALHHLERRLFEAQTDRVDPGDAVRLLEAGGDRAEVELVAAEVLDLLIAGVPAEEIAVVYRSPGRTASLIERVFAQYGIASSTERSVQFGQTALGRSLVGLARCAWLAPPQARASDLLDYLRFPGLVRQIELLDKLEAQIRREGLTTVSQARERLGWELAEIDALRGAADRSGELARQARRLLSAPGRGTAPMLAPDEELDARALGVLLGALAELEELEEALDGAEVIELIETLEVPADRGAAPGAIVLADPLAIRARRFRAVFVCGLQEGEFPLTGAPEPFLSDEQRRELALCSGLVLRPSEDALARERYLFYACVSRATQRVVLSCRSSDEEGNVLLPSPFVADVADLLVDEWPDRREKRLLADVVWPEGRAPTQRERARTAAAALQPGRGPAPAPWYSLSEPALRHVRHRELLSAGALESYANCPVKWLVERELAPQRFEPDPDPLTRGSYVHRVLEEVLRRLDCAITPESLPQALATLEDVMRETAAPLAVGASAAVRDAAVAAVAADLRRYLAHEARDGCEWQPTALELRFGFTDEEAPSLPALELEPRVRLRGVVDRVDVGDGGRAIVRDYKSGSSRAEHQGGRWSSDRQLQVALYMLAVRELLGLKPVAGLYQPLGGGDLRARGIFLQDAPVGGNVVATDCREEAAFEDALADARARAVALAGRLRSGELVPCPATCSRDGCLYPGICRAQ